MDEVEASGEEGDEREELCLLIEREGACAVGFKSGVRRRICRSLTHRVDGSAAL